MPAAARIPEAEVSAVENEWVDAADALAHGPLSLQRSL
ncbi:hypothetical protein BN1012_Phect2359 [Candidatus Phaeomarinobacter ectocarpi]|uniref:Uncharacterized protein n=1 Tax=Candidatus Phaeomarinibacter ectocarpi TaxID=1458461 RepID=X5MDY6_9HYPH|nr:hypothetical protein BN1012_Phect2359 [Candidatus Phaeomarinobacter ectocarpi]